MYIDYFLINPKTLYFDGTNLGAIFYSKLPNEIIKITWQNALVY
jgi:hypothetical protein